MGIKKKKTFTQTVAVGRFLIFQNIALMTAKAMSAHQTCTIEVFRLEKKLQAYFNSRPTGILQHLEVFYILF